MAWSNIFLQLTTLTGPILGEAQVSLPFTGQIELTDFSWSMEAKSNPQSAGGFKPSLSGAVGSFLGVGGNEIQIELGQLEIKKRFDISSASIMRALDTHEKILLASITVLNIQNLGPIRDPGFNLTVMDAYFSDVTTRLESTAMGAELRETIRINYRTINMTYLRKVDAINAHVPTVPFTFKKG